MALSAAADSRVSNSTASWGNWTEDKGLPRGREEEEGLLMVGRRKALALLAAVAAKAKDKVVKVFIFFLDALCVCINVRIYVSSMPICCCLRELQI